nr:ATP-dependent helicase [Desulfobacterales bacterium]
MTIELNPQQKHAAEFEDRHALVLAGAGTGKTRTIIARAAYLIGRGVSTHRLLLLTFTRRAAKEMIRRLTQMIGEADSRIMAGTFHHFCLYTMRRMPKYFGVENATVIDRDDQVQLMKLIRGHYHKSTQQLPRAAELVNLCSYARNTNQATADYLEQHTEYDPDIMEVIVKIAQDFTHRKQLNNYLDYDDILFLFAKKLHEDPVLRDRIRGFYDHILVDEMQDTNPLQWLILDGMRDPAKLFCVGDDAQSIYAFRGADFKNVHAFKERVPDSVVLRLEENYRSTQGILDLSNWLLRQSSITYDKELQAHRRTLSKPKLIDFDNEFDEARWIAQDLIERHETGADWKDHMIITRTGWGARAVESLMVENNIPYRFIGGVSLLQAAHVKDLLCLIRAAASHLDELAWTRYLTMWPRIGDVTATRMIEAMKPEPSIDQALDVLHARLKDRTQIIEGVKGVLDYWNEPSRIIQEAAHFLKPLMMKRYDNWDLRRHDFELLGRLAGRHRSIMAFIETYTLDPVTATVVERLEQDDVVTLTTAHSAKGTESPVCYIIRVEPGVYPYVKSMGIFEQEEEERRILYVAMTRAQDELIMTRTYQRGMLYSAAGRFGFQENNYFMEDLDEDLVDIEDAGYGPDRFSDYDVIRPWNRI